MIPKPVDPPTPQQDVNAEALAELVADLAASVPVYTYDEEQFFCALCDAMGDALHIKHEPECLVARARGLVGNRDAFAVVDTLGN